jgi:hypothetical protein
MHCKSEDDFVYGLHLKIENSAKLKIREGSRGLGDADE